MAAAAPAGPPPPGGGDDAPTFSWLGDGAPEGSRIYYPAFEFAGARYAAGDHVCLAPEEDGAPPYVARVLRAYEDLEAPEADRLCVEVRWYERPANLPAPFRDALHARELVETTQADANLVGCIARRATVVHARSFEEAAALAPPPPPSSTAAHGAGSGAADAIDDADAWFFCRGVLDSATATFRTYEELAGVARECPCAFPSPSPFLSLPFTALSD